MFYRFKKNKKAFTLVELIVVIAIIAILGGVAVGAYFGITNSAREKAATSPLNEIAKMFNGTGSFNDMTLQDYIATTYSKDSSNFYISDKNKWSSKGSDEFTLYFYDKDNTGDYYGVLKFKDGACDKKASTTKTKPSNFNQYGK